MRKVDEEKLLLVVRLLNMVRSVRNMPLIGKKNELNKWNEHNLLYDKEKARRQPD